MGKLQLTDAERTQRREQDRERLKQAAEQLLSSEGWQRWVRVRARGERAGGSDRRAAGRRPAVWLRDIRRGLLSGSATGARARCA